MSKLKDHGCTINEHITSLDGNSCECGYFTHQLIQAHINAEIARTLDRLEQDDAKLTDGRRLELDIPSWVEAERAKLKEEKIARGDWTIV